MQVIEKTQYNSAPQKKRGRPRKDDPQKKEGIRGKGIRGNCTFAYDNLDINPSHNPAANIQPTEKYPDRPDLIEKILALVADGKTLPEIEKIPGMPPRQTLNYWIATNKHGLSVAYTSAREARADRLASEVMEIADTVDDENPVAVQKARLQTDVRKWYLSHLLPEKYGDLQRLEVTGKGGGAIGIQAVGAVAIEDAQRLRALIFGQPSDDSGEVIDAEVSEG